MTEGANSFFEDYTNLLKGIGSIQKTKAGYGYTYLELTPLLEIVLPELEKNNFILIQYTKQIEGKYYRETSEPAVYTDKESGQRTIEGNIEKSIETPAFVLHSELIHNDGQKIECDMPLYVDDIDPQAIGSAETYMRRYSIYALLNIKVVDNDGLEASSRGKQNKKEQESKLPLPDDLEELGTFLMGQVNPKLYYHDIKDLNEQGILDDKAWFKLKKIMYPG